MVFKSLFTSRILPSPIQYEVEAPNIKLIKVVLQGRRGGQGFAPTPLVPHPRNPWATLWRLRVWRNSVWKQGTRHPLPTLYSGYSKVTLCGSRQRSYEFPRWGLWPRELPCDHIVMSRMRNQLFSLSPGERKGGGPWGQQEELGLDYILGNGDGQGEGSGKRIHGSGNALCFNQDELSSCSQGQGQLQRQRGGFASLDFL